MGLVWACWRPFCFFLSFQGQEPSPLWLWALEETVLLYSLTFCPALHWMGTKNQLQGSDPGIEGVP